MVSKIAFDSVVTVTRMNHITEIQHMEKMNHKCNIKKINKHQYVNLSTGEIGEYNHIDNRAESENSLRQTFKKLRYLINKNFQGNKNELMVTLTYAENMQDTKRLHTDIKKFIKKLRYSYKDSTTIDYLNISEPQERGAWHSHILMRFNDLDKIYIPNKFDKVTKEPLNAPLYDLWGHGWVTITRIQQVDNIGAYLSAYLTDIPLTKENETIGQTIVEKEKDGKTKKYIKGGRLHLYPKNFNIIRKSSGIVPPTRERMKYKNIKKEVGLEKPHFQKQIEIDKNNFKNTITYEQYNSKR